MYNFAKFVKTLRRQLPAGQQHWQVRTPAMAAGLTDRVWTVRELAEFVAPSGDQLHRMG